MKADIKIQPEEYGGELTVISDVKLKCKPEVGEFFYIGGRQRKVISVEHHLSKESMGYSDRGGKLVPREHSIVVLLS